MFLVPKYRQVSLYFIIKLCSYVKNISSSLSLLNWSEGPIFLEGSCCYSNVDIQDKRNTVSRPYAD